MPYLNLFDEISSIGEKFLKSTDRGNSVLKQYTWQLSSLSDLIKHTHSIVIEKLEAVEKASSIEEAEQVINELSWEPLTNSFRVNGLCDIFVGYGASLRKIIELPSGHDPEEEPPISDTERGNWQYMCDALEEREQQVAGLYVSEIQEIADLLHSAQPVNDLSEIKEKATRAKHILTGQMADFDSLAKRFKTQLMI